MGRHSERVARSSKILAEKRILKGKDNIEQAKSGRWQKWERMAFLEGIRRFGKGRWKKISILIPSRTSIQVKTHAQMVLKHMDSGEDVFAELDEYLREKKKNTVLPLKALAEAVKHRPGTRVDKSMERMWSLGTNCLQPKSKNAEKADIRCHRPGGAVVLVMNDRDRSQATKTPTSVKDGPKHAGGETKAATKLNGRSLKTNTTCQDMKASKRQEELAAMTSKEYAAVTILTCLRRGFSKSVSV